MTQRALISLFFLTVACGTAPIIDAGAGMDASVRDAGTDAGADAGTDAPFDAGSDAGTDAAVWVGEGCNPERGVECDGDWSGRCAEPCSADECCSPVNAEFVCVARAADGACPAADIFFDAERIEGRYRFGWRFFESADCALDEACVDGEGWRRLLRFATWTPNVGEADLYMGDPEASTDFFTYSECHEHFHFDSYARYSLRDATGAEVASGHKQSFCLVDSFRYPEGDARGNFYTCDNQGIQRGYLDVYTDNLDCQWVDITDVPPGEYVLHVDLNYEGLLLESDYSNNSADVAITVPPDDVTRPCDAPDVRGADRNCGLERAGNYTCTPGEAIEVACSAACGFGSCTGDAFLRVCDIDRDPDCDTGFSIGDNDNSYCDMMLCGLGGDCCPRAFTTCPDSGEIVVFSGAWDPRMAHTCDVVVRPGT